METENATARFFVWLLLAATTLFILYADIAVIYHTQFHASSIPLFNDVTAGKMAALASILIGVNGCVIAHDEGFAVPHQGWQKGIGMVCLGILSVGITSFAYLVIGS